MVVMMSGLYHHHFRAALPAGPALVGKGGLRGDCQQTGTQGARDVQIQTLHVHGNLQEKGAEAQASAAAKPFLLSSN